MMSSESRSISCGDFLYEKFSDLLDSMLERVDEGLPCALPTFTLMVSSASCSISCGDFRYDKFSDLLDSILERVQ